MKILFGDKYFGKDVNECPSSFLVWIIEEYKSADWLLITECKKELSSRLKLEWTSPPHPLSHKDQVHAFKLHIMDRLYEMEWDKETLFKISPNWIPKPETFKVGPIVMKFLDRINELTEENDFLRDVIGMSTLCKGSPYAIESYMNNPKYMYSVLDTIKQTQIHS